MLVDDDPLALHPPSDSILNGNAELEGGSKDLYEFLREAQLEQYFIPLKSRLKVVTVPQLKYVEEEDMADIGMSRPEMRRLMKYFQKECPQTAMGKLRKLIESQQLIPAHLKGRLARSTSARATSLTRNCEPCPPPLTAVTSTSRHLILPSELELGNVLGSGEFGKVHQGVWTPPNMESRIQVAVKVLEKDKLSQEVSDFMKEVALMHSLDHPDIVRLFGVVMDQDCLKMVTELAPLRSLLECLKEPAVRESFSVPVLHSFCLQIAHGMEYLEGKRLIHRDLAARNILVFSKDKVKISDFGMSRALQLGKEYYQTNFNVNLKLPIAWCAPECINYLKFTSASDVWAYGITLWEIFSYGFQPWAGLTGQQILERIDEPNMERLHQPDACPTQHYELMLDCWKHEAKDRPNFIQISNRLPRMTPDRVQALVSSSKAAEISSLSGSALSINSQASTPVNEDKKITSASLPALQFKAGDIIVVLDKSSDSLWKGCLLNSKTGSFMPSVTKPYVSNNSQTLSLMRSPLTSKQKFRISRREEISESSRKAPVRGRLKPDMIGLPENDLRHIGHVGFDGSVFGDVTFMKKGGQDKIPLSNYVPASEISVASSRCSRMSSTMSNGQSHKRSSPSGSCLTITTVSEAGSRLSNGTLTDVSSCLNDQLDDGEESPPYETLDQHSVSVLSKRGSNMMVYPDSTPPPLPPGRANSISESNSTKTDEDDLFAGFSFSKSGDSSGLDFGSSLMDDIFKCLKMDDDEETRSSTPEPASMMPATQEMSQKSFLPASKSTPSAPPSLPLRENVSPLTSNLSQPVNSPSRRQEAIVKPMLVTRKEPDQSDASSVTSCSSADTNSKRKFSLGPKLSPNKKDELDRVSLKDKNNVNGGSTGKAKVPIYAKPMKLVSSANSAKKQAAAAATESKKGLISGPILVSGPSLSSGLPTQSVSGCSILPGPASSLSSASNSLNIDIATSVPTGPVLASGASTTPSTGSGSSVSPAASQSSMTSNGTAAVSGVGALRALQKTDGVFRAGCTSFGTISGTNRRRPSAGDIGGTLTRTSFQANLPSGTATRFTAVPERSLPLGTATSLSITGKGSLRRQSTDSSHSTEEESSGGSPEFSSGEEEHPTGKFSQLQNSGSDNLHNGNSSPLFSQDAASFWGTDLAGLLGSSENDSCKKTTAVVRQSNQMPTATNSGVNNSEHSKLKKAQIAEAEDDDDIILM